MAEQVVDSMLVKLRGDGSEHEKMWQEAQQAMMAGAKASQRAAQIMENAFSLIKAALPLLLIKQAFTQAIGAFSEAEEVSLKLKATLEGNGRAVDSLMGDYQKFAESMQRVTRLDDDAVLGLLQVAETMGLTGDAAKRAAQNAIGLAAARGIDAKSALRMTAALEQGRAEMLQRYFPALRNIKDQSKKVATAHEMLGKTFGVAKASAQGMAGQYDQLSNALGNIWEDLGEVLAEIVKPLVSWIKDLAVAFKDMLAPAKESAIALIKEWGWVFESFKVGFVKVFGFFWNFKENAGKISAWLRANWESVLVGLSEAFGVFIGSGLKSALVWLEWFTTEFKVWGGLLISLATPWFEAELPNIIGTGLRVAYKMLEAFGKAVITNLPQAFQRAAAEAATYLDFMGGAEKRKMLKQMDELAAKFSNAFGKKDPFSVAAKKTNPKNIEEAAKASAERFEKAVKDSGNPLSAAWDAFRRNVPKLPELNLKNPLDELLGPKAEEKLQEAKKFGNEVKKALPFYGENEAVRRGTSQYHAAIKSTVALLAKVGAKTPLPIEGKGAPSGGVVGSTKPVLPAPVAGVMAGLRKPTMLGKPSIAASSAADANVYYSLGKAAAESVRRQGPSVRAEADRRHKQAVDRVTASGVEQKSKTDMLLEQIRDALVKRKGNEIILVPSEAGG